MNSLDQLNSAREIVNGTLFVLETQMVIVFLTYMVLGRYAQSDSELATPWRKWPRVQAAAALCTFFLGSEMRALWIWVTLLCDDSRTLCTYFPFQYGEKFLLLSTWVALVGGVFVIRAFTPPRWGPWPWLLALTTSLAVPTLAALYF